MAARGRLCRGESGSCRVARSGRDGHVVVAAVPTAVPEEVGRAWSLSIVWAPLRMGRQVRRRGPGLLRSLQRSVPVLPAGPDDSYPGVRYRPRGLRTAVRLDSAVAPSFRSRRYATRTIVRRSRWRARSRVRCVAHVRRDGDATRPGSASAANEPRFPACPTLGPSPSRTRRCVRRGVVRWPARAACSEPILSLEQAGHLTDFTRTLRAASSASPRAVMYTSAVCP